MWIPAPYRTIACYVLHRGIDPADQAAVIAALPETRVELTYGEDGLQHMHLNGEDVTSEIRLPQVSACASVVSAYPQVRSFLLDMRRRWPGPTTSLWTDGISGPLSFPEPR